MIIDRITQPIQLSVFKRTPDNWVSFVRTREGVEILSGQDNIGEASPLYSEPPKNGLTFYDPWNVYILTSQYGADLYIATIDSDGKVEELLVVDLYDEQLTPRVCNDPQIKREFEFYNPEPELRETVRRFLQKKAGYRELKEALR